MRVRRWAALAASSSLTTLFCFALVEGCTNEATISNDICLAAPSCVKGTPPSASQAQQCHQAISNAKCGNVYKAMKECTLYRAQCSSTGTFNSSATNTTCAAEIAAHNTCLREDGGTVGVDGCTKRTCSQARATCGQIEDGCGGVLECGTCSNEQVCGGGGTANRCGCQCDPTWCGTVNACGTTLTCPNNCQAPQFCGGGGVANRCGCAPAGSLGPLTAASVSTATVTLEAGAQQVWSSTTNARLSDNRYATATMSPSTATQYLVMLGYGFTIPDSAKIEGITVQVERSSSLALATKDHRIHLVKEAQVQTSAANRANGGLWPVTEETVVYGDPTDTWTNTWTPAEINAGGFGVAISAQYTGTTGSEQARIDAVQVTIHYSNAACN